MKRLLIAFLAMGFTQAAQAGFLVEPYLGYYSGKNDYKFKSGTTAAMLLPDTYTDTATGIGLGSRLGYKFAGLFFAAADIMYFSGKSKGDSKISSTENDMTGLDVYAVGGIEVPFGLRAWLGVAPLSTQTVKSSGGDTVYSGMAYKLGVGFKVIPLLSVNAEYIMGTTTSYKSGGTTNQIKDIYDKFESSGFFISVSAPLHLGGK